MHGCSDPAEEAAPDPGNWGADFAVDRYERRSGKCAAQAPAGLLPKRTPAARSVKASSRSAVPCRGVSELPRRR